MKLKNKKKGFTLVELLVVIAILAILATVSVVGYTAFITRAHQSNAKTEADQIKQQIVAATLAGEGYIVGTYSTTTVYVAPVLTSGTTYKVQVATKGNVSAEAPNGYTALGATTNNIVLVADDATITAATGSTAGTANSDLADVLESTGAIVIKAGTTDKIYYRYVSGTTVVWVEIPFDVNTESTVVTESTNVKNSELEGLITTTTSE